MQCVYIDVLIGMKVFLIMGETLTGVAESATTTVMPCISYLILGKHSMGQERCLANTLLLFFKLDIS